MGSREKESSGSGRPDPGFPVHRHSAYQERAGKGDRQDGQGRWMFDRSRILTKGRVNGGTALTAHSAIEYKNPT